MRRFIEKQVEECERIGRFAFGGNYLYQGECYLFSAYAVKDKEGNITFTNIVLADMDWNLQRKAPPEVEKHFLEHCEELIDNAAWAITSFHHGENNYVIEDGNGLHRFKPDYTAERLIFFRSAMEYKEKYYEIAKPLIGEKCYLWELFYAKIALEHDSMTVEEALEYLKAHPEEFTKKDHAKPDPSDPIVSIKRVDITRRTDNTDKNTFDFVSVEILLRSTLQIPDMKAFIRENLPELNERALEKIAASKKYQSFGVPVEFLSLYSIGTFMQSTIRMMYELREVSLK